VSRRWTSLLAGAAFAVAVVGCQSASYTVQPAQLPNAAVGQAYEAAITAAYPDGTPVDSFALVLDSGALPTGLSLRQSYESPPAAVTGTPTTAGTYTFKLRVNGGSCTMAGCPFGERDYTLVVTP
jgi:hypothetical protein